jgi:glutamate racemase
VLGTDATVRQPYVDNLSAEFAADCLVLRHGSARLVELAEAKLRGEAGDPAEYRLIWDGLLGQPGGERVDTVVLACTHFPLVAEELRAAAPRSLAFVDGGDGIARRVAWLTQGQNWPDMPGEGTALFTKPFDPPPALLRGLALYGLGRVDYL